MAAGLTAIESWVGAGLALAVGLVVLARWRLGGVRWGAARWALRLGLVLACAAACAGPRVAAGDPPRRRAVVLDISRSLARAHAQRLDWARGGLADLDDADLAALVLAGAEARVVVPLAPASDARARLEAALSVPLDDRGSDLGAALRLAAAEGVEEVLLVSDGRETTGSLLAAAGELSAAGVRLHTLAPDVARPHGVRVVRLEAPDRVAPGERIAALVEASASRPGPVTVALVVEDALGAREVGRVRRDARAHTPWQVRFSVPPLPEPGLVTLRARVQGVGPDDDPGDDVREAIVAVGDPPRVWRVGSAPVLEGVPSRALAPAALGPALEAQVPDLIVIADVAARDLTPAVARLRAAVEGGAGLVVGGARLAFGPGGYADTPLERLLPLTSGPAQERSSGLDLVVALDASGSMGAPDAEGRTRYQQAVSSAVPLHRRRVGDRLGVVLFAGKPERFAPLRPPAPDLLERLVAHQPGGETDVGAALALGLETLDAGGDRDASLLVATDSEDPDPRRHAAAIRERASRFAPGKLRVVLALIGRAAETGSLQTLAEAVGPAAQVVRAADADQALRELVASELASRRNERRAGPFAVAPTEDGRAWGLTGVEELGAYAPTQPRADAEVLARVRDAETDDPPACALWRLGAGRVLAAPVEAAWLPQVLGPALGRLLPPRQDALGLTAARAGDGLRAWVRGPLRGDTRLWLLGPGSRWEAVPWPLTPEAARVTWDVVPATALQVVAVDGVGQRLAGVAVAARGADELAAVGIDPGALIDAAQAAGGDLLSGWPSPERPLPRAPQLAATRPLGPWLWGLALLLLLADAGWAAARARR